MSKFNFKQFLNILDFYNNGSEWNNPLNNEWLSFDLGNSNHNSQNEIRTDDLPQRSSDFIMPDEVPILPLRGLVVYPQTAIPLTIGQSRSINLIDDVISHDRLVGLVASRNPDLENPGTDDLYHYGTLGIIHRFFRAPDGTIRLLVQGVNRFLIKEYIKTDPYLFAKIELSPEIIETGLEIEALARSARDQFNRIADLSPSIPRELVSSVTALQDPLQTIYTIANFQRIDLDDAQSLLEINSTSEKLLKLVTILSKECEVLELGQKIQNDARSEIEKVQREYYLN